MQACNLCGQPRSRPRRRPPAYPAVRSAIRHGRVGGNYGFSCSAAPPVVPLHGDGRGGGRARGAGYPRPSRRRSSRASTSPDRLGSGDRCAAPRGRSRAPRRAAPTPAARARRSPRPRRTPDRAGELGGTHARANRHRRPALEEQRRGGVGERGGERPSIGEMAERRVDNRAASSGEFVRPPCPARRRCGAPLSAPRRPGLPVAWPAPQPGACA